MLSKQRSASVAKHRWFADCVGSLAAFGLSHVLDQMFAQLEQE